MSKWSCAFCTFENTRNDSHCNMCGAQQPFLQSSFAVDEGRQFLSADDARGGRRGRKSGRGRHRGGGRGRGRGRGRDSGPRDPTQPTGRMRLQGSRGGAVAATDGEANSTASQDSKGVGPTPDGYQRSPKKYLAYGKSFVGRGKPPHGAKILVVGEKPSIAKSIADHLSSGSYNTRKGKVTPVHEFEGKFQGVPCTYRVTSVTGHVYQTDFVPGYSSWEKTDPVVLFDVGMRKQPADKKGHICRHLQAESKGCDAVSLWLDCDKEGENICFEVLEHVLPNLKKGGSHQKVYRAKFSSITRQDIRKANENLSIPNENESKSVDARQELDLRFGAAFTRFQSRYFQGKYGNLNSPLISFGPCQTPTLGFCVERHDQIQTFVPEKYWVVSPTISTSEDQVASSSGHNTLTLEWERGRCFDMQTAQFFHGKCSDAKYATVTNVSKTRKKKPRPGPLNTVELLKVASKQLGIGPGETMHCAESLYIQGYISYPRTETTSYAPSFDLNRVLQQHSNNGHWGDAVRDILAEGLNRPKSGNDAGDHPPITPMRSAEDCDLGGNQWRIYDYITRHFIATVSKDCTYERTRAEFEIGLPDDPVKEVFKAAANKVLTEGFTSVMHWMKSPDDKTIDLKTGQRVHLMDVKLQEKKTSPPGYLTEAELIDKMEKHGIGTDASIPTHIESISSREFVHIGSGRTVVPNTLGIVLVHGYQKIDPELVIPTMRSRVEKILNLIALGEADYDEVVEAIAYNFKEKFKYFMAKISKMDSLFGAHFSTIENTHGKRLSKCGNCHKWMNYIGLKPCRLHCSTCDQTWALPQRGTIKLFMEKSCPICDFELVLYSTGGENGLTYPLCPYCYNNPPFEDIGRVMGCNTCLHPTCANAVARTQVKECPQHETCKGMLTFDSTSGPNWKLCCNSCNYLHKFAKKAIKVKRLKETCDECKAYCFSVTFHRNANPLDGDETQKDGCLFCDPILAATQNVAFGNLSKRRGRRGGRGRGRGRGRRIKMFDKNGKPTQEGLMMHNG